VVSEASTKSWYVFCEKGSGELARIFGPPKNDKLQAKVVDSLLYTRENKALKALRALNMRSVSLSLSPEEGKKAEELKTRVESLTLEKLLSDRKVCVKGIDCNFMKNLSDTGKSADKIPGAEKLSNLSLKEVSDIVSEINTQEKILLYGKKYPEDSEWVQEPLNGYVERLLIEKNKESSIKIVEFVKEKCPAHFTESAEKEQGQMGAFTANSGNNMAKRRLDVLHFSASSDSDNDGFSFSEDSDHEDGRAGGPRKNFGSVGKFAAANSDSSDDVPMPDPIEDDVLPNLNSSMVRSEPEVHFSSSSDLGNDGASSSGDGVHEASGADAPQKNSEPAGQSVVLLRNKDVEHHVDGLQKVVQEFVYSELSRPGSSLYKKSSKFLSGKTSASTRTYMPGEEGKSINDLFQNGMERKFNVKKAKRRVKMSGDERVSVGLFGEAIRSVARAQVVQDYDDKGEGFSKFVVKSVETGDVFVSRRRGDSVAKNPVGE
jgi:hypothetical protein